MKNQDLERVMLRLFGLLLELRLNPRGDCDGEVLTLSAYIHGYLEGLLDSGVFTIDLWRRFSKLHTSCFLKYGEPFPTPKNFGPVMPYYVMRDRLYMRKTAHVASLVPALADALPSPAVGPELPELEQVPALTEVVAHVEPLQVSTPAPRRELWLLCVLVEPRSSALEFQPGRFATVATVRRLPPFLDCLGRWNYDQSKWMVCANSIYVPCAANGLYLRQTPVLRFVEVLERVRQRTTSAAASSVLATGQQRGQAGAVRADGHNARYVRAGVMA